MMNSLETKKFLVNVVTEFRTVIAGFITVLGGALSFVSAPDWPVAVLLTACIGMTIVLAMWGFHHFQRQYRDISECKGEKEHCHKELAGVKQKLHRRDMVLVFALSQANDKRHKSRRATDRDVLDIILGEEDARSAKEELKKLFHQGA